MRKAIITSTIFIAIGFAIIFSPVAHLAASVSIATPAAASAQAGSSAPTAPAMPAASETVPAVPATPAAPQTASPAANATPVAQAAQAPAAPAGTANVANAADNRPARVAIPAISLNDPIQPLGINAKGEMDVPNGSTNNIGWYEYGTVPGDIGSAVFDAHVFAALSNLHNAKIGDDIYVTADNDTVTHFRVYETDTYTIADVPLQRLFNDASGRYLNLITCAGHLTPDHSTYDHRLVVYAELVP